MGTVPELLQCLAWVSSESARLLRLKNYGLLPGCRADFIVFDAPSPAAVIAEISAPLMGFKAGRQTFSRAAGELLKPGPL
jgi:cytosine deaminase